METKDYVEPEEMRRILIHADVFAFGMMISEILTGCSECKMYKGNKSKKFNAARIWMIACIKNSGEGLLIMATEFVRMRP